MKNLLVCYSKTIFLIFLTLVCGLNTFSQVINTKGVPFIQHFENGKNENFSQIWDIAEAPNHIMYFVNEKGLLEYDGSAFNFFSGSKGITRSLYIQANDTIYTGSDDDFGIWTKDRFQTFKYRSMYQLLKGKSNVVEEFWNIYTINKTIIFQSFNNLYCVDDQLITKVKAPSRFIAGFQGKNKIYLVDQQFGFYVFDNENLQKIDLDWNVAIDFSQIVALDEINNKLYVITKNSGIYIFENNKFSYKIDYHFQKNNDEVFAFTDIQKKYLVLGTIQNGIYIIDKQGNTLHYINKLKGLQNNTVLSLYCSKYGKLWLGLDFGIDALHLSSPYSFVLDSEGKIGTTYAALLKNNLLYLGTNQGLYSTNFSDLENSKNTPQYTHILNSQGQVWCLKEINQHIYCGHNKGLFELQNNQIVAIDKIPGVWTIVNMYDAIITGNYNGIHIYKYNSNQQLQYFKTISEIKGSCNQLLVFQNKLFVLLGNIGILELTLNNDFEIVHRKFYDKKIFGNDYYYMYLDNNNLVIENLKYRFFKDINKTENFKYQKISWSNDLLESINQNNILPQVIDNQYTIYAVYNGFSIYNKATERNVPFITTPKPITRYAKAFNNSNHIDIASNDPVNYRYNNISLRFIVPNAPKDIQYQYLLKGFSEKSWSDWSVKTNVDFINLKEGNYQFKVRARSSKGISEPTTFIFKIKPPIFRRWWAYIIYFLLTIGILYWIKNIHDNRLKKQKLLLLKEQKERLYEQSVKYQEKIMEEKNQKLELEKQQLKKTIENKELELAKKIIDQKEINELIQSIQKKVEDVQYQSAQKLSIKNYKELMSFLDKKVNKQLNKEYEIAFDSSQTLFHEKILKVHPKLSAKDLRISSYIIMNLSSKEIAKILQVLPSSIDVNRSRLRKKLELTDDVNLRDYLLKFHS